MEFSDTSVVVTGGSRGLGFALASELASRGARVVLVAREPSRLDAAVERIRAQGGVAFGIAADVGDVHAVHPLVGRATALVGPVDLVVHAASVLGPVPLAPLAETECEDFARTLRVNVLGPFRITKALVGSMVVRGRGLVVHVSSDAATVAYPRWGAYGVSKAALDHLARSWDAELEGTGVRSIAIDPGEMDTDMHADAVPDADRSTLARPEDVARAIATFLEREGHAHGTRFRVDGGEVRS